MELITNMDYFWCQKYPQSGKLVEFILTPSKQYLFVAPYQNYAMKLVK